MIPTASTSQISLDTGWLKPDQTAPDGLKNTFMVDAVRESLLNGAERSKDSLSDRIEEQQAADRQIEGDGEAQEQRDSNEPQAQEMRDPSGEGPVSVRPMTENGSHFNPDSPKPRGRIAGMSGTSMSAASRGSSPMGAGDHIIRTSAQDTKTPGRPAAVQSEAAGQRVVLRNMPAAVLRAIEVEAALEAGVKTVSRTRSSAMEPGSRSPAVKSLAEAESRTLRGMTSLLAQRGGRLRIQLQPVQLGPVQIEVEVDGDRVRASIETSTRGASKILEASTSRLKAALEAQGYSLERLDVRSQNQSTSEAADQKASDEDEQRSDSERADSDGRSNRRGQTSSGFNSVDEDMSFEQIREQEQHA